MLGIRAEHPVRVEMGQDPLPQLAELARPELRTGSDQMLFRLGDPFDRDGTRQLLDHPADLPRLLIGQRARRDRIGNRGQDRGQVFTADRYPRPEVTRRRHPPRRRVR